jgi:Cu(I)/Ag(I) efflux system membrane fusion protein
MNTRIKFKKYLIPVAFVLFGLVLGYFIGKPSSQHPMDEPSFEHKDETTHQIWTCAMHPQIKMDKPGKCPICGMDLISLQPVNAEIDEQAIQMSESAMKLAEVETSLVGKGNDFTVVLLYGKIQADEKLLQSQAAHVPGRIEKLFINVTGEAIKKGQRIASIYSPELITAQKELIEAISMTDKYPAIPEAARQKLRNWKLSDEQIRDIETSGTVSTTFDILANTSGIITSLKKNEGDYVRQGEVLFDVADLSQVWAVFDAYESDLPHISLGQMTEFTSQAIPGKTFTGTVSFIDPVIDPVTRIARVRAELGNSHLQLKPGMFINGILKSKSDKTRKEITIPQSAVLWTGRRSVVYVKIPGTDYPSFKMREITLGASLNDSYIILDGLKEGEEIVTHGTFSVDAAAQLAGKPSMMNPTADKTVNDKLQESVRQDHKKMQMVNMSEAATQQVEQIPQSDLKNTAVIGHTSFLVYGNCEMCKDRIETAAISVDGVISASWNKKTKILEVAFDESKTDLQKIHEAIANVGHDTDTLKASDEAYSKLPACCKYDREE